MNVEIELYSGRPNPDWDLNAQEVAELLARLRPLPHTTAAAAPPDKLGYRGLRIALPADPTADDAIVSIDIGAGVLTLRHRDGTHSSFADPERAIERWLLSSAQGRIDEALRHSLLGEIGAP